MRATRTSSSTVDDSQPFSASVGSGTNFVSLTKASALAKASDHVAWVVRESLKQGGSDEFPADREYLPQPDRNALTLTSDFNISQRRLPAPEQWDLEITTTEASTMASQPVIHDIRVGEAKAADNDYLHSSHPFFGVLLAVTAACLVGASFIFQKKALIRVELKKNKKSYDRKDPYSEFAYLRQWMWWCGMLSMAAGEIMNFVAYSVAPAILVTPLGALRVIVSAVLSSIFLGEHLNVHGKVGILLSLAGSVMIIIYAPRHEKVTTFEDVLTHFMDDSFLVYCFLLVLATIFLITYTGPRYGRTNVMVYISVCNIVGALCVLCGKGLGISLKEIPRKGSSVYLHPVFWLLVLANVVGIITQIVYLNKALAIFNASTITPIKYVFTNVFLVFGSILLFQEFDFMSVGDVIGITCGFATVVAGVVLLNVFKDNVPEETRLK